MSDLPDGVYLASSLDNPFEVEAALSAVKALGCSTTEELLAINNADFCDDRLNNEELFRVSRGEDYSVLLVDGITVISANDNLGFFIRKADMALLFHTNQ